MRLSQPLFAVGKEHRFGPFMVYRGDHVLALAIIRPFLLEVCFQRPAGVLIISFMAGRSHARRSM